MTAQFHRGDRVVGGDAVCRIDSVEYLGDGRSLLGLLPSEPNGHGRLPVILPPDRVVLLPTEELVFDSALLSSIGPWLTAHRALALTTIRDASLTGARYGRVALEAYQVAPVLRILSKPSPRLLIADDNGLGKTIEAGLRLLELMHPRRAERVLIVVPPGLIPQWLEEELHDRFGLDFTPIETAWSWENIERWARATGRLPGLREEVLVQLSHASTSTSSLAAQLIAGGYAKSVGQVWNLLHELKEQGLVGQAQSESWFLTEEGRLELAKTCSPASGSGLQSA